MTPARRAKAGAAALLAAIFIAALTVLVSVDKIAPGGPSYADEEAGWLANDALVVCVSLAAAVVLTHIVEMAHASTALAVARSGLSGALVAVVTAVAAALVLAYAIDPWMDPGEAGRTWFPFLFGGALLLGVIAGAATAGLWPGLRHEQRIAAAAASTPAAAAALIYLAGAFSEYNQCWVNDEFPLSTDHVCAGY